MIIRCRFDTRASAEQAFRAYTDFSDRRLTIWRDTLSPEAYELCERSESSAVVREGSVQMGVLLRYEWEPPGTVRWSIIESSFCDSGTGSADITSRIDGGAHVEVTVQEQGGHGIRGKVLLRVKGLVGPFVLTRTSKRALDRFADEDQG